MPPTMPTHAKQKIKNVARIVSTVTFPLERTIQEFQRFGLKLLQSLV